ncbi:MAG: 3-oxoacyl-[acyl-carrier-protein] reductase [Alphaproteobacteria bacterium]
MRKVMITGATGGIGKAICKCLNSEYEIFIVGRDIDKISALQDEFSNITGSFKCDLSNSIEIENMIKEITNKRISIDILINNAGVTDDSLFIRMDKKKWKNVIETNLNSNFHLTSSLSKQMIKNKWGRIINITSVIGHTGNFGQSNYSASKAGIIAMSKSVALELAKRNITVNCISPGFIETSMTSVLSEEQKKTIIEKIPIGDIGSPMDVAYCVQFLASDKSKYITGQTLHVNGGLAML